MSVDIDYRLIFLREKAEIHSLLDTDDLIGGDLDKKCIFTYLLTLYHGLKNHQTNKLRLS